MEALGKVLRKGVGEGQSAHQTTQYEKLSQEPSDEEGEEDDIVFLQDGLVLHQNGFTKPTGNHVGNHKGSRCLTADEAVELGLLQKGNISRAKPLELVHVKSAHCRMLMRRRLYWCLIVLLLSLGLALIVVLVKPYYRRNQGSAKDWQKLFPGFGSESCIRLVDVDGDGRLDVIFSMSLSFNISSMHLSSWSREQMKALCAQQGESYPCLGRIVALRGNDSHQLWMTKTHFGFFELSCGKIDINKDGQMDCIGTGRLATVVAFDPRNGSVFWTADTTAMVDAWSAFNVVILPDFNGDQIPEVLLPHSSDPRFPPEVHERYAGRLILLDGATGKSIGRFLKIPEERETYMSPVLHTFKDGSQYILFGSGGETVPGSLLAISVPDFYRHAMSLDSDTRVPNVSGKYNQWKFLPKLENQFIMELYRSGTKGIIVPPVCVDVSGDGIRDILLLAFDGNFTLYDGLSLKPFWSVSFPGTESYSSPAPGYFNDDDRLDFMLHLNHGSFPDYDYSTTVIIDGKTGVTLWALNSSQYELTSDLVARTTQDHFDFFIFRIKGRVDSSKLKRKRRTLRSGYEREREVPRSPVHREYDKPASEFYERPSHHIPGSQRNFGQQHSRDSPSDYPDADMDNGNERNYYAGSFRGQLPVDDDFNPQGNWDGSDGLNDPEKENFEYEISSPSEHGSRPKSGTPPKHGIYGSLEQRNERLNEHHNERLNEQHNDYDDGRRVVPNQPYLLNSSLSPSPAISVATAQPSTPSPVVAPRDCSSDLPSHAVEVFLLDRTMPTSPLRIYQQQPQQLKYKSNADVLRQMESLPNDSSVFSRVKHHEFMKPSGFTPSGLHDLPEELCAVLELEEKTTGAVGDVDGDGFLDLISIETVSALITDQYGGYLYSVKTTKLSKFNLELKLKRTLPRDFVTVQAVVGGNPGNAEKMKKHNVRFRPTAEQPWTAYLGTDGDSVFK